MNTPDDFLPTADWAHLRLRAELLAKVRQFFAQRGFLEVETPILSADVVVDRHLDPIAVTLPDDARRPDVGRRMWLQTSPEFGMKRLLAAGAESIYQITRAFRAGEFGSRHNPEFTMVEWYRRGDSMRAGMQLLSELAEATLARGAAEVLSYAEAFGQHVGVDPHGASAAELESCAARHGVNVAPGFAGGDRDAWLNLLLAELVEPHLGTSRPTILYHYPASQAALATVCGDPPLAERFELYVDGIELANGYHELVDPGELRRRSRAANESRARDGKPSLPGESRLLAAMDRGLPASSGVALGFDRLVMVATGASTLSEVMAFTIERA